MNPLEKLQKTKRFSFRGLWADVLEKDPEKEEELDEEERQMQKLVKIRKMIKEGVKVPKVELATNKNKMEVRANEAMSTGQDGYGQDFVPTDLSSQIVLKARNAEYLFGNLGAPIVMSSASFTIPVEGGDMTWYASSEQANVAATEFTNSKAGTDDITLVAKKYTANCYASGELDEDSIININQYLTDKLAVSYSELLDRVLMLGDTTTAGTGNINSDDAAPTAGTYYLHQNGLIKNAFTNSLTYDCGTLDVTDIRALRAKMWKKGLNPNNLIMMMDVSTYYKILGLSQVETIEKFGGSATIVNGVIVAIDGIKIIPTDLLSLTDADGKYTTTSPSSNNTKGRILIVHKPSVLHGFKRNLKIFTEYLPQFDQFRFTAHVRYALAIVGTDSVAYGYNITV